jgi:hypothetical protein
MIMSMIKYILEKLAPVLLPILAIALIYYQHEKISDLNDQLEIITANSENLSEASASLLAEQEIFKLQMEQDYLVMVSRIDSLQVDVNSIYIPPEGSYQVIMEQDSALLPVIDSLWAEVIKAIAENDTVAVGNLHEQLQNFYNSLYTHKVVTETSGFCLTPAIGGGIDDDATFDVDLGARLFYLNRFSAGLSVGTTPLADERDIRADLFVDYRIPKLDNLAPKIYGGYGLISEDWEIGLGVNFLLR